MNNWINEWISDWLVDGWVGRQMDESTNQSRTIFQPFKSLAAFPFQVRIAIYYLNYPVIKSPAKILTWPALILSKYLTTDLEAFILSKCYSPFSGCLVTGSFVCAPFALLMCFPCSLICITLVMLLRTALFSKAVEESDVTFSLSALRVSPRQ